MKERLVLLISDISADETQIDQIYQKLCAFKDPPSDPEQVIIVGYYLHNLYTAFEHICTLVARAFENQVPDRDQWHSLLLRRMTQNIEGIRQGFSVIRFTIISTNYGDSAMFFGVPILLPSTQSV